MSATSTSHLHPHGKLQRSSGGTDISSVNSQFIAHKDCVVALANGGGDAGDDSDTSHIPPVPPLLKEYQSSSSTVNSNVQPLSPRRVATSPSPGDDDEDRTSTTTPTIDSRPE